MESKKVAGTILSVSIRVAIFALALFLVYFFGRRSFEFGTSIFDEKSVDVAGQGYDVMITIPAGSTNKEVADILYNNGLITDTHLFLVQLKLSDYSKSIKPGEYVLNTSMKPTELMEKISPISEETESAK